MKMAALPSPTQVAGKQYSLYETYFNSVEKQGAVPAVVAAKFLKTSGLTDDVLGKIWDLSDPHAKGFLNRIGFFVALKLVSLAQLGHEVSINNLMIEVPPPKLRGTPLPNLNINAPESAPVITSDWSVKTSEKLKYEQLFESLQPVNGFIPGNKVKGLLIDSKLPVATLGKIWDLADMDKDGSLDKHEFIIAMHLVYKALEKYSIPDTLPPELLPPAKEITSIPPSTTTTPAINGLSGQIWVVSAEEKAKCDALFLQTDVDKDGYVSGHEIKDVFLQSGVHQSVLANIWALCDIKQSGKLNAEQFALAMWLIHQKVSGHDPPATLSPNMIPPSFRSNQTQHEPAASVYSNPELDMITKDIEELTQDKQMLEAEILHKEAEIKIRSSEAKSLQGELDTLAATLKQLENQKGEAQKRLNDLKNQCKLLETELKEQRSLLDIEKAQVDKLRKDAEEQETLVRAQEEELTSKKQELEMLKVEESKLEARQSELAKTLNDISNNLQESQLTISQVKTKIIEIQEHQKILKDAIAIADNALLEGDVTSVAQRYLQIEAEYRDPSYTKLISPPQNVNTSVAPQIEEVKPKPQTDLFPNHTFGNDNDMFAAHDSFASTFSTNVSSAFGEDPFRSFGAPAAKSDPFDPFGGGNKNSTSKSVVDTGEDPFGCEPFAAPAPALPPKNKQPPPRPAPPRPAPPPSQPVNTVNDGFADFSAFNKGPKLEFTEDPFKDYRYEDPFSIEDPFKDVPDPMSDTNHTSVDGAHDPFLDSRNLFVGVNSNPTDSSSHFNGNEKFKSQENMSELSKSSVLQNDNSKSKTNGKENVVVKSDSLPVLLL